jgi:hypothetical protein
LADVLDRPGATVLDPACGDGALLLAAAEPLLRAHLCAGACVVAARRTVVTTQLHGWDIHPAAVEAAGHRLRAWADLPPHTPLPGLVQRDALLHPPLDVRFDAVVGNPPYLSARATQTAPDAARRAALDARWPGLRLATTDAAALFVAASLEALAPHGRAALILPQSFIASDGASAVRAHATDHAAWIGATVIPGTPFPDAAVEVVILTWTREPRPPALRVRGTAREGVARRPTRGAPWAPALAASCGWPTPDLCEDVGRLGDLAAVTADFRDQFYGLIPHVHELPDDEDVGDRWLRLAVSGAIDPAVLRWGARPTRYAGRTFARPVVDAVSLGQDSAMRAWAASRLVPKVIVATQGRVLEAVTDEDGRIVPAVPILSVSPRAPTDLQRALAVVLAPACAAWLGARVWGAGLSSTAIKASAKQLATLPLPTDPAAWDAASHHVHAAQRAAEDATRVAHLRAFAHAMDDAYRLTGADRCATWWLARLLKEA